MTIGVVLAVVLALIVWTALSVRLPDGTDFDSGADVARYVMTVLHAGPLPYLLALPKLAVAPYFATGLREFVLAMIPALLLLGAHYFWVVRIEVAFEEASIARAEKRAARQRASQQGDWRGQAVAAKARTPAFALGGIGRPELAFLWKNLLATHPFFRPRPLAIFTTALVVVTSYISSHPDFGGIAIILSVIGIVLLLMTVLLGPQFARLDLRTDLVNSDILKTYPLRGWQVVLGELLTPVVILTVLFWLALLTVRLSLPDDAMDRIPTGLRTGVALGLAVLGPPFIAIQVFMPNAAAVLFPAWVQATRDQTERGIEVLGQRMIFVASQLLVTALALLPAFLLGAAIFFLVNLLAGFAVAAGAAVLAMAALLALEAWLGILWLGDRFEALDISSELRP